MVRAIQDDPKQIKALSEARGNIRDQTVQDASVRIGAKIKLVITWHPKAPVPAIKVAFNGEELCVIVQFGDFLDHLVKMRGSIISEIWISQMAFGTQKAVRTIDGL